MHKLSWFGFTQFQQIRLFARAMENFGKMQNEFFCSTDIKLAHLTAAERCSQIVHLWLTAIYQV